MPTAKFQVNIGGDSGLARDYAVNVLYFDIDQVDPTSPPNYDQLCHDLIDAYQLNWLSATAREVRVRAYNMDEPEPRAPVGEYVENLGSYPVSTGPREIALCLSFRGDPPVTPRRRGRIFLPVYASSFTAGTPRPNDAIRTQALKMADSFAGLGGLNVDWVINSAGGQARVAVKHAWVDDEWDVQRRRGFRSTTRTEKDVGP